MIFIEVKKKWNPPSTVQTHKHRDRFHCFKSREGNRERERKRAHTKPLKLTRVLFDGRMYQHFWFLFCFGDVDDCHESKASFILSARNHLLAHLISLLRTFQAILSERKAYPVQFVVVIAAFAKQWILRINGIRKTHSDIPDAISLHTEKDAVCMLCEYSQMSISSVCVCVFG